MGEVEALFLLLGFLYVTDCVFWVHRHSVAFVPVSGSRWRPVHPSAIGGNNDSGLLLTNPLPLLGPGYLCHLLPVSLSPRHARASISQTLSAAGRPHQTGRLLPYADIQSVDVSGREVRINGERFVRCPGTEQAAALAGWLKTLLPLAEARRAAVLTRILGDAFSAEGARERIRAYTQRACALRILCNVQFFYLFVVAPGVVWEYGITRSLAPLAAGAWVMALATAVLFWRVHKALYPGGTEERVSAALKMALCPPIAARANEVVSWQVLAAYHPLTVASLLCGREEFERFAKRVVLDIRHPIAADPLDSEGAETERWYRKTLETLVEGFLGRCGLDAGELLRPPPRTDSSSESYCPRCQVEYAVRAGECADCSGVRLSPFDAGGGERPRTV